MADSFLVHKVHALQNLLHEVFDFLHGDQLALLFRILDHFLEILLAELKD